jgi:hypothetical protein
MNDLPAYLKNGASRGLAHTATVNLGTARPPTLSIRDNKFTLIDSAGNAQAFTTMDQSGPYADVVIVDLLERKSRTYYEHDFPGGDTFTPPDCWSDNGIGPSRQASSPQSPTCANCPQAVWGAETSRVTGKGIPACHENQKLAIVVPGFGEHVFVLRVPPASLKNFRAYAEQFRGRDFDLNHVVTRLSFQKLGTLQFAPVGWIDEATHGIATKAIAEKATDGMLGRHDVPAEGVALPGNRPSAQIAHQTEVKTAASPSTTAEPSQPIVQVHAAQIPSSGRRRGRPPAQVAEQPAQANIASTAPFRPNPAPPATPLPPAGNSGAPFGIQPSTPAPTGQIAKDLDSVFGKK